MYQPPKESIDNADLAEALSNSMMCLRAESFQFSSGEVSFLNSRDNSNGNRWNTDKAILTVERTEWLIDSIVERRIEHDSRLFSDHFPLRKSEFTYGDRQYLIECGEASGNGSFCYAILRDQTSLKLVWQLFLDSFNPFEYIWHDNGRIDLFSTSGWCCSISLNNPNIVACERWSNFLDLTEEEIKEQVKNKWSSRMFPREPTDWLEVP